ncbi:MAG: PBSX family phage terminase large subunit [Oscillospiraceae bacterium]|nr:PBSX family phage terminase large subunit [Oscillospiraceae bacterium]
MIYRKFSRKQMLAMTWWNREKLKELDGIICDGAIRSGKTVSMVNGFFLWSMTAFDGQVFALCGKTIASLRRNIVLHLQDWLGGIFTLTEHRSENKLVVCDHRGRQNVYYLFGGQDESAYKLIQGITLAGVLLDEAALMPRSFVEQACARCSVSGSKLWFNCNPEGPEHWLYKEWILRAREKKMLRLQFSMADNLSLDPGVKQRYERLYTGVFYRRYILGQWCMAEGLVYDFDKEKHVTEELPQRGTYYISVDYGTLNPFSAGLWCVDGGRAVRIREFYHSGRESGRMMTDEEYYRELVKLAGGLPITQVIVDPSAASFIATIRAHGLFSVRKAKNDVLPGIRLVAGYLAAGVLLIGESCKDTIREFGLYRYEQAGEKDRVCKENDHAMDDVRYFCATVLRRDRIIKEIMEGEGYERVVH